MTEVSVPATVTGNVTPTLALRLNGAATFATMYPGVAAGLPGDVGAAITSTGANATLSVADPSNVATGHLVNGTYALQNPLQVRATNAAQLTSAFAPVTGSANPLTILTYPQEIANDAVAITFKQTISATEGLRAGEYAKTVTFTLSTTQP